MYILVDTKEAPTINAIKFIESQGPEYYKNGVLLHVPYPSLNDDTPKTTINVEGTLSIIRPFSSPELKSLLDSRVK
jgi:hypothetical protein